MKLCELIRKYPFDMVVPVLVAQDPDAESQLAWYKQAFDTLLETTPAEDSWEIEVVRDNDEMEDGTLSEYVHARHCEGQPWDGCLASEVVIEDGISQLTALARILWGMTFYGYTKEQRERAFCRDPRNLYEHKADRLRNRNFRNYAYGLAGEFELKERALTGENWKIFRRREAHCNRPKRMRDARQRRSVARLDRAGAVQSAIDRFELRDRDSLVYLFDTRRILELNFTSHVQTAGERAAYIAELLTKYYRGDLSGFSHCEILFTTSGQHPLSEIELHTLNEALAFIMPHSPAIRYHDMTDDAVGLNLKLFMVLSC